jgi:hypothetical protein
MGGIVGIFERDEVQHMNSVRALKLFVLSSVATLSACGGCGDDQNPLVDPYFVPYEYGDWEAVREPDISAPDEVLFGDVAVGESATLTFEVRNVGRAELEFSSWELDGPDFSIDFPQFMGDSRPARLEPGGAVQVTATFTASVPEGRVGTLTVGSNDPDEPVTVIELVGNIKRPCLTIEPDGGIDFGVQDLGETARRSMRLSSCSPNADTVVDLLFVPDPTGAFDAEDSREFVLAPGEEATVDVRFTPPVPGVYETRWELTTNEERDNTYAVPVTGRGKPYECPVAAMSASAPGRDGALADPEGTFAGVPLDVVQFDGERSRAFDGARIERYEWSIVQRPADSSARIDGGGEEPSLFLDLSGDYMVELDVVDSRGTRSCQPARMAITSVPDEDIHVQLVWDTPSDADQLDGSGSDVDLHLLHPNGNWDSSPWDCHWKNLEPDWGRVGRPEDNPSLDIDDVTGWGPENINYNNPTRDLNYSVGVFYYDDHGYGSSYVTIRVYLGGVLDTELRRKRMSDQQFWHVLDIAWPEREVVQVDRMFNSFP